MEKTLARKRWLRLIPIAFITYSLAYLDRANFGFAAAGGMAEDLDITAAMSSLLGSLFFLGYFFFQIPGALYAANKSAKRLIFWSLILWGVLAMATGLVSNVYGLIVIRFMLGVVESAVMPSMLIFLSRWFTRAERSRANTFLILGNPATILWMSILSGYLVGSVGWRWMFIVEGFPAILWALLWWRLVVDRPKDARWLTGTEKVDLQAQLDLEQQSIKPVKNYAEAFRSRIVVLLCLQYALWSIGVYGFVMWLPSIINAAPDSNIVTTGWLASVPYILAITGMLTASYFSDKTLNRKLFIWPFLLIGTMAFYGSYLLGTTHFWLSFDCRRGHVCSLRALFCSDHRSIAPQCFCGSNCTDQQPGCAWIIRGCLYCGLPEWYHRRLWGFLYIYGWVSFSFSHTNHCCPESKEVSAATIKKHGL